MTTYELKSKDNGMWMDTLSFMELVAELHDRFGVDAEITQTDTGFQFALKKINE